MVTKKSKTKRKPTIRTLTILPDIPLSDEAEGLLLRIRPRIQASLEEVSRIPVSVLLWGPGLLSESPLLQIRQQLRAKLRQDGHAAVCGEEVFDPDSPYSLRLQQLVHAQNFDLVVSTPYTPGSIAEVHDFVSDKRVRSKLLIFLNQEHAEGYSVQSIEAINATPICRIEYYPSEASLSYGYIEERTITAVQQIREVKYILAGS